MQKNPVTPDQIKKVVADFYNKPIEIYDDKKRLKNNIIVKHMAIYMVRRNFPKIKLKAIAEMFGLTNHATVISVRKKIDGYLDIDKSMLQQLNKIQYIIDRLDVLSDLIFVDMFLLGKSIN